VRSNQQEIQIGEFKSPFQKQSSEFKFYSGIMANANNKAIIDEILKAMGPQILAAVEKATGSSSTASTARPENRGSGLRFTSKARLPLQSVAGPAVGLL